MLMLILSANYISIFMLQLLSVDSAQLRFGISATSIVAFLMLFVEMG